MSDAQSTNYQRSVSYLVQVLQKNPLEESAVIIRGRNRLLGLQDKSIMSSPASIDFAEVRQRREKVQSQIEQIRKVVWTAPLDELRGKIKSLGASDFPDIQATVDRLATVATQRNKIPALVSRPEFDGQFFSVFKEVLASAPREVAVLKERLLMSFGKAKTRQRGKKMIKLLKTELPALYELEASWLSSLTRQKKSISASANTTAKGTPFVTSDVEIPWWVYVLAVVLIRMLIRAYS